VSDRVGVGMGPGTAGLALPDEILAFARAADELGFAHLWVNDHLSWREPLLDPMVFLSHVAAATSRIGLATGVYLLPLRSPVAVARQLVSLDYLSGGRAIFGVGVGGEFDEDFSSAGIARTTRGRRTDQALRLLRRLLSEDVVDHTDDFYDLEGVSVLPHPVRGRLPIIAGGRSAAAIERAASLCDGWMPYFMSPERVRAGVDELHRVAAEHGRDPASLRVVAHVFASFGSDLDAARDHALAYLSRQYRSDMTRAVATSVAVGPPEECARFLGAYFDAGATDVVIRPMTQGDRQLEVLSGDAARTLELLG
jgi:probable F420-dependent oxidoreductase